MKWICCQVGGRELYAIPRALARGRALDLLVTDAWIPPGNLLAKFKDNLGQRFHRELEDAPVVSANLRTIAFELKQSAARREGWARITRRNEWFQKWALRELERIPDEGAPRILFAYSYAALQILRWAKRKGWQTILGQLDPGFAEEEIAAAEVQRYHDLQPTWSPAPFSYWEDWREECSLADSIIVNSNWSLRCLGRAGIDPGKVEVIPLAYERTEGGEKVVRDYPSQFTSQRPLRVLFLGQITIRKGVGRLMEAARLMTSDPVEFWMVGQFHFDKIRESSPPNMHWFGRVPDSLEFFRQADVFILPTLSDGFALTQLEAMAEQLPVITSRYCGEVVRNHVNGLILDDVTPQKICTALRECIANPGMLSRFSQASGLRSEFSVAALGKRLLGLSEKVESRS